MFSREIITFLAKWFEKDKRKPLVIRGARQVGKTVAVTLFGQKHFKNMITLNLEKEENLSMFQRILPIRDLIQLIQLRTGKKIIPGSTLLFIDEIQNSQIAMTQMRYFYEEVPALHVVAAGSLLEIKIKKEGFSFPLGRVEYCYMHPVTFPEFLTATEDSETLDFLKTIDFKSPVLEEIHHTLLKKFHEYIIVGGMPEAVAEYKDSRSFIDLDPIYESLLTGFKDDVYKYASNAKVPYLQHVIEHSPKYAGKTIKYEKFGDSGFKSREMKEAFDVIEKAMIVKRVNASTSTKTPIDENLRKSPKLIFLDTGLVNYSLGMREDLFTGGDLSSDFLGHIAEQVVGQALQALTMGRLNKFSYWVRDKKSSTAEVDFLLQFKSGVVPIEVKSGKKGHLKSLFLFMEQSSAGAAVRIHSGNLKFREIERNDGSKFKFISLPFYLVYRLEEVLDSLL